MEWIVEKVARLWDALQLYTPFLFISIMAGMSRSILTEDRRSLHGYIRGFVLAVFVGYVASIGLKDLEISEGTKSVIIAVCSFTADDILIGIVALSSKIKEDPKILLTLLSKLLLRK